MLEKVISRIALEKNLDYEIVEKVIRSQFKFVADTMSKGEYKSIHLHHLGKFAVKPNRLKQFKEYEEACK